MEPDPPLTAKQAALRGAKADKPPFNPEADRRHVIASIIRRAGEATEHNVSGPAQSGNKSTGPQSVFINGVEVAGPGPEWDQLISILPLLSYLPIGAIIIKIGNRELKLAKKVARALERLTETERKSVLASAKAAKTDDEAAAIIKREVALIVGDRQIHHAISETVYKALEKHKNLRGKYQLRDKRFESLAIKYEAHHGWEAWHRQLDEEVAAWVEDHKDATEAAFEAWLRRRYAQPDLKARFPKEF